MATGGSSVGDSWSVLFDSMKQMRAAWPQRGWSWDNRFMCLSSSFNVELEPKARAAAAIVMPHDWSPQTLHQAPQHIRDLVERTGGLRAGQLVLAGAPVGRAYAYGLWWPWGDGVTTSLRLGLGPEPREDVFNRFRDVFGVTL
jgi:hypothetical protein